MITTKKNNRTTLVVRLTAGRLNLDQVCVGSNPTHPANFSNNGVTMRINGFDKFDKPFTATLTKKGREPIDIQDVKTVTYDITVRSYVLNNSDGIATAVIPIDELQRLSLTRNRKDK